MTVGDLDRIWSQEELHAHVKAALHVSDDWIEAHGTLPQGFKYIGASPLAKGDIEYVRQFAKEKAGCIQSQR
jgi:hypothetical protein